jgi:serine/threonine protein phosphatase 1
MTTERQLVITDIHGCSKTFFKLLEKIGFTLQDKLFLLGDYIDKGKDSAGVLDLLLELIKKGYKIFPLRGNHEQRLLQNHHNEQVNDILILGKAKNLTDLYRKILPKYYQFLIEMPYYYELKEFFLVHAGFNLQAPEPFLDYESMLWIRDFEVSEWQKQEIFKNKTIVFGHNPTPLGKIIEDINYKKSTICLDNGCVLKKNTFMGNLICLNLNNYEYTIQENID